MRQILCSYEQMIDVKKCFLSINVKDAILFASWAWEKVTQQTIINCWKKTGLYGSNIDSTCYAEDNGEIQIIEMELESIIKTIEIDDMLTGGEYIDIENTLALEHEKDNDQSDSEVQEFSKILNDESEASFKKVSMKEALNALKTFESFVIQNSNDDKKYQFLKNAYNYIYFTKKKKLKQMTIADFKQ